MIVQVTVPGLKTWPLRPKSVEAAATRAMRKAGSTALRDMRSEASKRVRARKAIKAGAVGASFILRRPKGSKLTRMVWAVDVMHKVQRVSDYRYRQTKKGVSVAINKGKRSFIESAFVATMKSGHRGVFVRKGKGRLPIVEPLASRVVDALLHKGEAEAVLERGQRVLNDGFARLFPLELDKGGK